MNTMNHETRFTTFSTHGAQRVASIWQTAAAQPGWVSRFALMTFVFVIAVPLVLLALLAFFAATLVYTVLLGINFLMMKVRGVLPVRDGRKNVRVLRRKDV